MDKRRLFLAESMGICNGVRRALDIVDRALAAGHAPLYILHEIVHNNFVMECLRRRGVFFVEDPADVPDGACLILSAHGTSPQVRAAAEKRLQIVDATCPLVRKVQQTAFEAEKAGERVILLGHAGHPEVIGILGYCPPGTIELVRGPGDLANLPPDDGRPVRLLTQTTLNADEVAVFQQKLAEVFTDIRLDRAQVCYATRDRQQAVRELAKKVEYMLILGSFHSSNAARLLETARKADVAARQIDTPEELVAGDLAGIRKLGLSAGASVPDELVDRTVARLAEWGFVLSREG